MSLTHCAVVSRLQENEQKECQIIQSRPLNKNLPLLFQNSANSCYFWHKNLSKFAAKNSKRSKTLEKLKVFLHQNFDNKMEKVDFDQHSIGSISAWYRGGPGIKSRKGENFSVKISNWIVRIWIQIYNSNMYLALWHMKSCPHKVYIMKKCNW